MNAHPTDRTAANNPGALSSLSSAGVCGSLDPPIPSKNSSKRGWRYIQCTNVQDELRVLLPPRPAAIYANLLKVEAHAIAKNDADSLREVQHIRYLKDAMVKRCQKLVKDAIENRGVRNVSVVEAPLDFKLKRLEQWWESIEAQGKTKGHSKSNQDGAERSSRMQVSASTATVSPNNGRAYNTTVVRANTSSSGAVTQSRHVADVQSLPTTYKKRPAPLAVPVAGSTVSAQSSPLIPQTPHSPNTSTRRGPAQIATSLSPQVQSPRERPGRPQLKHATAYNSVYANNQMTSPLETPYDPSFDPNQPLAAQEYLASPAVSRNGIPPEAHSPMAPVRYDGVPPPTNDPRMSRQHVYSAADALAEPTTVQTDPSHLKSRFHATYAISPANSSSSPSSNGSKPSTYIQQNASYIRDGSSAHLQAETVHSGHFRTHGSLSMPLPSRPHGSSENDHRRRATVDGDDTDRGVPRPKTYMYRGGAAYQNAHGGSPEVYYAEHAYDAQGLRHNEGGHSPSAVKRIARAFNQSLAPGGSPLSSTGSQGSPLLHGSPGSRPTADASPHSQSSPGKNSQQTRGYGSTLTTEQAYNYPTTAVHGSSPTLLPPDPGLSRSRRGSNETEIAASGAVPSAQGTVNMHIHPKQQLRRTTSRRGLRDRSPAGGDPSGTTAQPVVPPTDYYSSRPKSSRRTSGRLPDAQQPVEGDIYQRGRTRRGERSPHRRYDTSPRRGDVVIPDRAILTPMTSNRNSRYTSGGSSVSEPVIPDVELIMEAELTRSKGDRIRRRLVPLQSSSEEGGSRYVSDFEDDDSTSDDDGRVNEGFDHYKPPYRTRDGYGSGYTSEAEGAKPRAPSRAPSRSPSRGILKRSSSVCSARSNKSVRLEIPRDRRALEEVRDAEEKVEQAHKRLEDLQRKKGDKTKSANPEIMRAAETLNQAQRSLNERENEYQTILKAMKIKQSDQDGVEPRYV